MVLTLNLLSTDVRRFDNLYTCQRNHALYWARCVRIV